MMKAPPGRAVVSALSHKPKGRCPAWPRKPAAPTSALADPRSMDERENPNDAVGTSPRSRFPGVYFQDGPTGRRARLVGGPDVWAVIRALRNAKQHASSAEAAREVVSINCAIPTELIKRAEEYAAAYPEEVEAFISQADLIEDEALPFSQDPARRAALHRLWAIEQNDGTGPRFD